MKIIVCVSLPFIFPFILLLFILLIPSWCFSFLSSLSELQGLFPFFVLIYHMFFFPTAALLSYISISITLVIFTYFIFQFRHVIRSWEVANKLSAWISFYFTISSFGMYWYFFQKELGTSLLLSPSTTWYSSEESSFTLGFSVMPYHPQTNKTKT